MKKYAKNNRPDFSKTIAFFYVLLVLACFGGGNTDYNNADTASSEKISLHSSEAEAPKAILSFSFDFPDEVSVKITSANHHFSGFEKILKSASNSFFKQVFDHQSKIYLTIKPLLFEKQRLVAFLPIKDKGDPLYS